MSTIELDNLSAKLAASFRNKIENRICNLSTTLINKKSLLNVNYSVYFFRKSN